MKKIFTLLLFAGLSIAAVAQNNGHGQYAQQNNTSHHSSTGYSAGNSGNSNGYGQQPNYAYQQNNGNGQYGQPNAYNKQNGYGYNNSGTYGNRKETPSYRDYREQDHYDQHARGYERRREYDRYNRGKGNVVISLRFGKRSCF